MKEILLKQLEAALATLNQSLERCPLSEWNEKHDDDPFCQVLFHTLFYTDVYLGRDELPLKEQSFHKKNGDFFMDYEELEDRIPANLYDRDKCRDYMRFCLEKSRSVLNSETEESLAGLSGFSFREISRGELYIYLIRHIQHHAAQLGLRIQKLTGRELNWVGSGWKEF